MVFTEMARSRDLPIYKAGYQLLKLTTSAVSQFTRELRPTLGQQLHSEAAGLVLSVYRANAAVDKRPHLASLLESLEVVDLMMQLAFDLKLINPGVFAEACEILADIGKQAGGWQKYELRRHASVQVHASAPVSSPAIELLR